MSNMTNKANVPTARQLKVNLTLWRKAVTDHGAGSTEAYNAHLRLRDLQAAARKAAL